MALRPLVHLEVVMETTIETVNEIGIVSASASETGKGSTTATAATEAGTVTATMIVGTAIVIAADATTAIVILTDAALAAEAAAAIAMTSAAGDECLKVNILNHVIYTAEKKTSILFACDS